jgi:hypothetical protein
MRVHSNSAKGRDKPGLSFNLNCTGDLMPQVVT